MASAEGGSHTSGMNAEGMKSQKRLRGWRAGVKAGAKRYANMGSECGLVGGRVSRQQA